MLKYFFFTILVVYTLNPSNDFFCLWELRKRMRWGSWDIRGHNFTRRAHFHKLRDLKQIEQNV